MYKFAPGTQDVTVYFELRDSNTGAAKTGLTAASAGAQASYTRKGGSAASVTLTALAGPTAAHTDGGFIEVDATKSPGLYRLDLPDAACASGVAYVVVSLTFSGVLAEAALVNLETPVNPAGAGSTAFTVTVNHSVSGNPIAGAAVWVTTDSAGSNVVAGTSYTNAFGQVTFYLDTGSYYLWVASEGYTGSNPTAINVT